MTEQEGRAAVIAEATGWLGTPFHHMGRLKGPKGGVDCAQLVWCVFYNVGLTPYMELEFYPPDFFMHRDAERYMKAVMDNAHEVEEPQPGDIVLFKIGRLYAHGAIIADPGWPYIIHAWYAAQAVIGDRGDQGQLVDKEKKFFSRW